MRRRTSAASSGSKDAQAGSAGHSNGRCTKHRDALFWTALRLSGDHDDAQDLMQLTYLKAMRRGCRERGSCKPWLVRILTNSFIDEYRRRRQRPAMPFSEETWAKSVSGRAVDEEGLHADVGEPPGEPDPAWLLSLSLPDEVLSALDSLPRILREIVMLRDVEDYSYRECAEILGIPLGTVMSRLHRARRSLQGMLIPYARTHGLLAPLVCSRTAAAADPRARVRASAGIERPGPA